VLKPGKTLAVFPNFVWVLYEIWELIAMDIVGPVRESRKGYRYILVISDYASRFVITIPMKDQKAHTVAKHLVHKVITKYGARRMY
jgi:hypothetical protein